MLKNRDDRLLKKFGKKLKKLRVERQMSTRELADIAEIAHSQVWVLETGRGNPSLTTLMSIATALKVTLGELDPRSDG